MKEKTQKSKKRWWREEKHLHFHHSRNMRRRRLMLVCTKVQSFLLVIPRRGLFFSLHIRILITSCQSLLTSFHEYICFSSSFEVFSSKVSKVRGVDCANEIT